MALIPITGWPSNYRTPGTGIELRFAQGPSSAEAGIRDVCFVMPKLASGGTWQANMVQRVTSEADAIAGAGAGSPLHRACRAFLRRNKTAKLFALPYLPSSGTAGTADLDVTVSFGSGSNPTATGTIRLTVCGEACEAAFTTASTATSIAASLVASVNAKTWLPVSATNASGVITLVAKIAGKSQGDGTVPVIRVHCQVDAGKNVVFQSENSAVDDFLGNGAATAGAEGSTAELTNLEAALDAIAASRRYFLGISAHHADELAALKLHVATKSEPRAGLRCVGLAGFSGTLAAGITRANALNHERIAIAWQKNSEHDIAELVAALAAVRQKREEVDSTHNFDSTRSADWGIRAAWSEADWPDSDDLNDAINNGLTAIASDQAGSFIVMSCNTRSKNEAGTVDDFRATETHRVSGLDFYADTIAIRHANDFGAKKLKDDERLADGTVNANQRGSRNVVRPSVMKAWLFGIVDEMATREVLDRVAEIKESTQVVVDPNNNGRLEVGQSAFTINLHHQTTFRVDEVTS
jgi:phage tail sheath gpL-like